MTHGEVPSAGDLSSPPAADQPAVWSVERVAADAFDWSDGSGPAAGLRQIVDAAAEADGRSALNEAALLALRHHGLAEATLLLAHQGADRAAGLALVLGAPGPGPAELNVVVAPRARRAGACSALVEAVVEARAGAAVTAWSHGNHPAAAALARSHGFDRVRDLWVMRRSLVEPLPPVRPADGVDVRPFRVADAEAFLAVNAAAFAHHREQGTMTRADLEERMAEPWFDADGFFLAFSAADPEELLGFHWTKVHDDRVGEVYVVGISPQAQGRGLGGLMTLTGLHHLRDRGLAEVLLYVESDNEPAVKVYERLGFTHADADTDVMYALSAAPPSA